MTDRQYAHSPDLAMRLTLRLGGSLSRASSGHFGMLTSGALYALSNALLVSLLSRSVGLQAFGQLSAALIVHVFAKEAARNYWATSALASGDFTNQVPKALTIAGTAVSLTAAMGAAFGFPPELPLLQAAIIASALPLAAVDFARDRAVAAKDVQGLVLADGLWAGVVLIPWLFGFMWPGSVPAVAGVLSWLVGALAAKTVATRRGATRGLPPARWVPSRRSRASMMFEFGIANGIGLLVALSLPIFASYESLGAFRGVGLLFGVAPIASSWVMVVVLRDGVRDALRPILAAVALLVVTAGLLLAAPRISTFALGDAGPAAMRLVPYKAIESILAVLGGAVFADLRRRRLLRRSLLLRAVCASVGGFLGLFLVARGHGAAGVLVGVAAGSALVVVYRLLCQPPQAEGLR